MCVWLVSILLSMSACPWSSLSVPSFSVVENPTHQKPKEKQATVKVTLKIGEFFFFGMTMVCSVIVHCNSSAFFFKQHSEV